MHQDTGTALVVVDMQNVFVEIAGEDVLDAVNDQVVRASANRWHIFYTWDYAPFELPPNDPDIDPHPKLDVRGPIVPKGPGKNGGFSGFVLAPELGPEEGPGVGGLSPLAGLLSEAGIRSVIVAGIAADACVAATARDAVRLGYAVTVPLPATAFVGAHPNGNAAAIAELRAAGVTVTA